jgi:hypothetical protein
MISKTCLCHDLFLIKRRARCWRPGIAVSFSNSHSPPRVPWATPQISPASWTFLARNETAGWNCYCDIESANEAEASAR